MEGRMLRGRVSSSGATLVVVACAALSLIAAGAATATDMQRQRGIPPPDSPSNLTVVAMSSRSVILSWDDNCTFEDDFRVQRKEGATGTFELVRRLPQDATRYRDETARPLTYYAYRIVSCNISGCSAPSNVVQLTTPALEVFIGPPDSVEAGVDPR